MAIEENKVTVKGSLLRTSGDLSVTVCTGDADVLAEVGVLFIRLADIARKAADAMSGFGVVQEPGPVMFVPTPPTPIEPPVIPTNVFAPNLPVPHPAESSEEFEKRLSAAPPAPPGVELGSTTPAPPLPVGIAPTYTPGAELDGEGLPWDRRIHASTKTRRLGDNTWKLLKGLDPAVAESVKAELRAAMAAIAAPVTAVTAVTAQGVFESAPVSENNPVKDAFMGAPPVSPTVDLDAGWPSPPAAPPAPPEATTPPAPPATPAMTFPMLVAAITSNQQAGKITPAQVKTVCESFGLASLPLIASRPDLIPQLHEALAAIWGPS